MKFKTIVFIILLLFYAFFLLQKIDLTTADLGRHLKNGELFLKGETGFLKTNFYSYTEPAYPFINHHWLSGVLFFLILRVIGFNGLHLFFVVLSLIVFYLFFKIAEKESKFSITATISLLVIPLIAERTEIRPEAFSYLFCGIFLFILWKFRNQSIKYKYLWILPILELIWVNSHIYFIFGLFILGVFTFEALIIKSQRKNLFKLFIVSVVSTLITLLNPSGIKGALAPLNIFKEYGYKVVENQSVSFLNKWGLNNSNLLLFKIALIILILSFILVLIKNRRNFSVIYFVFALTFGIMGWLALRNFTIFGLFFLPIAAHNLKTFSDNKRNLIFVLALIFLVFNFINAKNEINNNYHNLGLGLMLKNSASADFFKKESMRGPIFNDYDVGGYLIYNLYPQEKVFTDNRPEAYSVEFFEKIYVPMQEVDETWQEQDKKYQFNAIFFSHRDYTPWAQNFLIQRIDDENWAPVFADQYNIIFLKRNEINKEIIKEYEIPRNNFKILKK